MRRALLLLLAIMLAWPGATGEGSTVPVDSFIERAGIEADAGTREKIEDFLKSRYISQRVLDRLDDGMVRKYAQYLAKDIPISYTELTDAPSEPLPEGAGIKTLAVLRPDGAATECLLIDFERGLVYYDETAPLTDDVCLAKYAGTLTEASTSALLAILGELPLEDQIGEPGGVEVSALRLCLGWDGGVTRCAAMGEGVSDEFLRGVRALLDAGRAAAQGDDL